MVQNQGIDVYLAPYSNINGRYEQHAVPLGSPAFTEDPNEVYIQAVDGERFTVVVDLLKDFDMKGAKHLYFTYEIDQPINGSGSGHCNSPSTIRASQPRGTNLKGRDMLSSFMKKVDGVWCRCGMTFTSLKIDEELDMTTDEVKRDSERHGKIIVTVERGNIVKIGRPKKGDEMLWDYYEPPDTKISSKEVVKHNRVSHAVGHVVIGEGTQPGMTMDGRNSKWVPLKDERGAPMKFTIRYRSRDALQKLKIIPKDQSYIDLTHSPPTSPRVKLERGFDGFKVEAGTSGNIKREPGVIDSSEAAVLPGQAPARPASSNEPAIPGEQATNERNRKRKAMEDELKAVELEQKRIRLTQALAEM